MRGRGGVFRLPRFRPPCVWVLITGSKAKVRGEKTVCTTFDDAKAALEPHALRMREHRKARALERELAAKKARR